MNEITLNNDNDISLTIDLDKLKEVEDGVYLYENNAHEFIYQYGIFSVILGIPHDSKIYPVIMTDNNFENVPEYVQTFCIQHEVGHMKNGDLLSDSNKALLRTYSDIVSDDECEADQYAADKIGYHNAINAITYILENVAININAKVQLIERRNILQKKVAMQQCA